VPGPSVTGSVALCASAELFAQTKINNAANMICMVRNILLMMPQIAGKRPFTGDLARTPNQLQLLCTAQHNLREAQSMVKLGHMQKLVVSGAVTLQDESSLRSAATAR
jgi:hypothetical protein